MRDIRHDGAITAFQQKRGGDAAAFFVPFLSPGMRLLDIGCGPGTITAALAESVGTAIGVDINPNAIASARQLAAHAGLTNLSFVEADMTALPFEDGAFDAIFCHAVLYHQSQAMLAKTLAEARRVLRPGGLLGTRDAVVGGNILHPEVDGVRLALDLWQRWYEHDDPEALRFGRRQSAVLRAHGFTPVWAGASYVNHSADAASRTEAVADARQSLLGLGPQLVGKSLATADEIETALAGWDAWGCDPDAVYFRCRCACIARKP
ncbi:class I SAM-dependent methyltransferase [Bradyrhizobium sp. GCM10023182]|uniref:Class I SAM-dependent methyltransferase n=1 Tax=Bradyrhizobium zhengyangense TaxID=2911009 RepID=A0ABS9M0E3_9BRAD|nr:class I SAM-dependent methyltransferase [Bradyrhizobium zhengyangense]MCG2672402.1 class I SAM-dependent methyltransferase [Bradyrhizobium zhengyangense]